MGIRPPETPASAPGSQTPGRRRARRRAPSAARVAAACSLLGVLGSSRPAHGELWTNINPGAGGAFTCAGAGPTGIILVGSDIGGLYRSVNEGASWTNVGYLNGGLDKCYISAVAFDPSAEQIVHLGTDGGLYRSTDGGNTFQLRQDGGFWSAIAVSPSNPSVAFAAKQSTHSSYDPRIFRTATHGQYWQQVGALPSGTRIIKLGVRPDNPTQLFAVSGYEKLLGSNQPRRALYVSSNGGATWTDVHGDSTIQGMTGNPWDAAYDPVHPDTMYATSVVGAGNPDESSTWSGYTWRGMAGTGAWTQVSAHTGAVLVRQGTGDVITVDVRRDGPGCAECGVFQSVDSGGSWTKVSDMTGWDAGWNGSIAWGYNTSFSGIAKTLRQDLSDPAAIYWITTQFVWRSSDWGQSFASVFTNPAAPGYWSGRGINNVAPSALSVSGGMLYAGYYDLGIWRSLDSGASLQASNDPALTGSWSGRGGNCMTILADPERPEVVWASQGASMTSAQPIRSTQSAAPGTWATPVGVPPGFITGLALDPASSSVNRTLYVSSNGDVYKSTNDGQAWSLVLDCDSCYVTAACDSVVFTGGQKGLWRSRNGGATWTELNPAFFHMGPSGYSLVQAKWNGPHDIVLCGDTIHVAVYGDNRGLYRSLDGGDSWTLRRADDYARQIEIDDYGDIYLGSSSASNSGGTGTSGSTGILVSRDSGATWSSLTAGLPWPFVWSIETVDQGDGSVRVFVGSPGSGFWTAIPDPDGTVAVGDGIDTGLRLSGFRPNPARERIAVAFTLSTPEPAMIEVFDLAGRRLLRRDVGWMGAGSHVLQLGSEFRPVPGLYAVRLTQGSRSISALSVVVR